MRSFERAGFSFTRTGQGRGTPAFMPPEQVERAHLAGPSSDIYSLAATLYFMVTLQAPIELGEGEHPLVAVLAGTRIPLKKRLPKVPKALDALVSRCLSLEPAKRPASVDELDAALADIAAELPREGDTG